MMIEIEKRASKQTQKIVYAKPSFVKRKFLQSPQYSESFISNRTETDSFQKDFSKQSSIYSNDSTEYRQRNHLFSLDFVQSSASFIYPNLRKISSGYSNNETNSMYVFSTVLSSNKNIPLVFLGSEYFLRKPIDFEHLKLPLSTGESIEPLIDLFLNRPKFIKELPELNDLSSYRLLPQSISGLIFFNPPARHLCSEFSTKEEKNKFTIKDLVNLSQRENNIIQINALNDQRYHAFKNQLTDIYSYQSSFALADKEQSKTSFLEPMTKTISFPSIENYVRNKSLQTIVTSRVS